MATYASDDEQLDALRSWWKDNGNSLLMSVALVLVAFFGVRQWQSSRQVESGMASDLYQQLSELAINSLSVSPDSDAGGEQLLQAEVFYNQLKNEFPDSIYTRYGALAVSKFLVDEGQEAQAASELQWVLDNPGLGFMQEAEDELLMVARLRLARIKLSLGEGGAALDLLRAVEPGTFTASYAELEGDILLEMGDREAAKAAYQRALTSTSGVNPVLLQLKLQDLGVSPVPAP